MFDSVVIGGGLAGCSAAITLARQGHQVALIEAGTYPRAKVCGEFLSPECLTLFERMGFLAHLQDLNPVTICTVRITAPDGAEWRGKFPAPALSVSRYALDQALINYTLECGVTVLTETRVKDVTGGFDAGFTLTTQDARGLHEVSVSSVIAAYGKRSNLDRVLKRDFFRQAQSYIGLKQHFRGPLLPQHIDLHVFHGGYCGVSQVEDGRTNVCLMVDQATFQQVTAGAPDAIAKFIDWMCADNHQLGAWLADAEPLYPDWLSIAQVSLAAKTPLEGDILCAGDSAGMIAPLAGDGMAMALHSGMLAADVLHSYLAHQMDAATAKSRYADEWRRTFATRLRLGRTLQSIMLKPAILTPGLRLMRTFPTVGNWLVNHTRDLHLQERTL